MKKFSYIHVMLFICFLSSPLFTAESNNKMPQYTSGPAVTIHSSSELELGYYFAKNNCLSVDFSILPYYSLKSEEGIRGNNTNLVTIGLKLLYYFPINKNTFNNKLFLFAGPAWSQTFGKENGNKIDYKVGCGPQAGLEYRINNNLYSGIGIGTYWYEITKFSRNSQRQIINQVFNWGHAYLTYKF